MTKHAIWYKNLGFDYNPFTIKPSEYYDELIGLKEHMKELTKLIKKGEVIFIEGPYGFGKTTLLKKVISTFAGQGQVIYYNVNRTDRDLDVDGLLYNSRGFFGRLFRIKPKEMIMFLDEITDINRKDCERLYEYYITRYFKSLVFIGESYPNANLSSELRELIGKNIIRLNTFPKADALKLIKKRLDKSKILSDKILEKIYELNPTPRAFLQNCEDACKIANMQGKSRVTEEHLINL